MIKKKTYLRMRDLFYNDPASLTAQASDSREFRCVINFVWF